MLLKKTYLIAICATILTANDSVSRLDTFHSSLSDMLIKSSKNIDALFFNDDNLQYFDYKQNFIDISLSEYAEKHKKAQYRLHTNANIKLKTLKNIRIIFSDYKKSICDDEQNSNLPEDTLRNNSYLLGLNFKPDGLKKFINYGTGIKFNSSSPDFYISIYFLKSINIYKNVNLNIGNDVKYFANRHFDDRFEISLLGKFDKKYNYFVKNSYRYLEVPDKKSEYKGVLGLQKNFNQNSYLSFSVSTYGYKDKNSPFSIKYYLSELTYRNTLYKNYIYYRISPGVVFRKENDFKSSAKIVFQIGYIIGDRTSNHR